MERQKELEEVKRLLNVKKDLLGSKEALLEKIKKAQLNIDSWFSEMDRTDTELKTVNYEISVLMDSSAE